MRLLIVEDEDAIRTAFARALATGGTEVRTAASLTEARQVAADFHPEALLSDLKLPDGSGLDFASECGVPFILMSGYAAFDDAIAALRMGCVDFFTKPVAIKDLRRALERLTHRLRSDSLQVVEAGADGLVRVQAASVGLVRGGFTCRTLAWSDTVQAQARYGEVQAILPGEAGRMILAELLQALPAGRLVINRGQGWMTLWLDGAVDWHGTEAERKASIEAAAERVIWRDDGVLIECSDD